MEKRGLLLLVLLLIPLASAQTIDLNNFILDPLEVQLGDEFTAEGYTTLDEGFVIVYIENGDTIREFSSVIEEGKFSIAGKILLHETEDSIPSGAYVVNVLIKDGFGHESLYDNVRSLDILTNLVTEISLKDNELDPGDSLVVEGVVQDVNEDNIKGEVIVKFDEEEFTDVFSRGSFSIKEVLKDNIESGEHTLYITVKDENGNYKDEVLSFEVIPKEEDLILDVFVSDLIPGDELEIKADLIDQAGELIDSELDFVLYDPFGDEFFSDDFVSGKEYNYILPSSMKPGTWEIYVISAYLDDVGGFTVSEVVSLEVLLSENELVLTNNGNVDYASDIKILARNNEGKEFEIIKRTGLNPGESVSIDLLNSLDEGVYSIFVLDEIFSDVYLTDTRSLITKVGEGVTSLTGNVVASPGSSTSNLPFVLFVIVFLGLIFYSNKLRVNLTNSKKRVFAHEKKKGQKLRTRLVKLKDKAPKFKFGKASESDVSHFKERILKDIREKEEAEKDDRKGDYMKSFLKKEEQRKSDRAPVARDEGSAFVNLMAKRDEGFVNPMKDDFDKPFPPEEKKESFTIEEENQDKSFPPEEEDKVEELNFDVEEEEKKDEGSLFTMFD